MGCSEEGREATCGGQSPAKGVSAPHQGRGEGWPRPGSTVTGPVSLDTGSRRPPLQGRERRPAGLPWLPAAKKRGEKKGRYGSDPYAPPAIRTSHQYSLDLIFLLSQKVMIIIVKPHNQTKKKSSDLLQFNIPFCRPRSERRCFFVQQDLLNVKDVRDRVLDASKCSDGRKQTNPIANLGGSRFIF